MSRTLAIIKPDAVASGYTGRILAHLDDAGFTLHALRMTKLDRAQAGAFYAVHAERPFYDSLVAKIITHADNRDLALARMRQALEELVVEGISTNTPLHRDLVRDPAFRAGGVSIHYLESKLAD